MTSKQSEQLVKSPNTQKALMVLERFARMREEYKALEAQSKEATELIKNAMIEHGVDKLPIDTDTLQGHITLAERIGYKLADDVNIDDLDEKYSKRVLDSTKLKAEVTLTGELPKGVEETRSQYIVNKLKVVE